MLPQLQIAALQCFPRKGNILSGSALRNGVQQPPNERLSAFAELQNLSKLQKLLLYAHFAASASKHDI